MGRYSSSLSRERGRGKKRRYSRSRSRDRGYNRRSGGGRRDDRWQSDRRGGGRDDYSRRGRRDNYDDYGGSRRDRDRRRRRSRSRSDHGGGFGGGRGNGGLFDDMPLDKFRHPSMSPGRSSDTEEYKMSLEPQEVAYVFGRMGSTKDKLGRVSGTKIELRGSGLLMTGSTPAIEKAKKYTKILLAQREGVVDVDPSDHPDDLTLMDIPSSCKGFVTGKRGNTLRQIERETATLMTFCRTEADSEPLAIFGTRRGRLYAQLKIMSIVEGKHEGWFIKDDEEHPEVEISEADRHDGDWDVSWLKLSSNLIGYALGRKGETRIKLQIASGCIIQYIGLWAVFGGKEEDRERGKTYLKWLLEQQEDGVINPDRDRKDLSVLWVPESSVGYVTGIKAKTLRSLETKTGTFCFFDKSNRGRKKEEMLIFSWKKSHREAAKEEVHLIVDFHQRKTGGHEKISTSEPRSVSRSPRRGSRSNASNRSGSRSPSRSRSRSYSRSRSRSKSQ